MAIGIKMGLLKVKKMDFFGNHKLWALRQLELADGEHVATCSFKLDLRMTTELNNVKLYFQFDDDDRDYLRVIPIPSADASEYCLIFRQRTVNLLSLATAIEIPLIYQTSAGSRDLITNGFCTGQIPNVKVHFIETKTNIIDSSVEFRSYTIFCLKEDFWECL